MIAQLLSYADERELDLLCIGDPVADIVISVPAPPAPGAKVLGEALGTWPGGTTANVACAASRLGLAAALFGRVGNDGHGALLCQSLARLGVIQDFILTENGTPTASTMIMIAQDGDKALVYLPMTTRDARSAELRAALRRARVAYAMPYELPQFEALCDMAREEGALVAIDLEPAVAPDPGAMRARAARADIVFFNESGFRAGTGSAPTPEALAGVLALGPHLVAVSLGEAGAVAAIKGEFVRQPAFLAEVRDTTGAGDCFNGAVLAGVLQGWSLDKALAFGCAAASCVVEAIGARPGLPDLAAAAARMRSTLC